MNEINYAHYEDMGNGKLRYLNQKLLPVKEKYRINFKVREEGNFFFKNDEERRQRIRSILGIKETNNEQYCPTWNWDTWSSTTCDVVTYENVINFANGN